MSVQEKSRWNEIPLNQGNTFDWPPGERSLLSFDETGETHAITPMAKAMEYAERAEYMYIAPGQATVSALLALFWLKVAELEGRGLLPPDAATDDPAPDE
jgi:hypothetical protein